MSTLATLSICDVTVTGDSLSKPFLQSSLLAWTPWHYQAGYGNVII